MSILDQTPHWKSPTIIRLALGWSLIRAIAGPSCDRGVDHLCFQRWNFVSKITGVTVLAPKRYPARNCSSVFQRHLRDSARDTRNDIAAASAFLAVVAKCRARSRGFTALSHSRHCRSTASGNRPRSGTAGVLLEVVLRAYQLFGASANGS